MNLNDEGERELTEAEARVYAAHIIRRPVETDAPGWDSIAEGHSDGVNLSQDACDLVRKALDSAKVQITWA